MVFAGGYEEHGTYNSDPRSQTFSSVTIGAGGVWTGGVGDSFIIETDFLNQSKKNLKWNTLEAELEFVVGDSNEHRLDLVGIDKGAVRDGFQNNFAWGILDINGQILNLADGNTSTPGGALYVSTVQGLQVSKDEIVNIFSQNGLNIYYDPLLNDYLQKLTYHLQDGGLLVPIGAAAAAPLPGSLWLLLSGVAVMAGLGRRSLSSRN